MQIDKSRHGSRLVIRPAGRLDSMSAPDVERDVVHEVETGDHDIVVDLSGLDYLSSRGLSALIAIGKRVRRAEGRIALAGGGEHVRQVLLVSGFDRLFPLFDSVEAALAAS